MITLCAWCKRFRNEEGHWEFLPEGHDNAIFTHGICPECLREQNRQLFDQIMKDRDGGERPPDSVL